MKVDTEHFGCNNLRDFEFMEKKKKKKKMLNEIRGKKNVYKFKFDIWEVQICILP